ncbi:unnamed protein product [Echinostoma caproni]|uniref:Ubiquinol-cytochrome c chaperone domain-containing protein n=1 Tax=Echinostoma caproni TaxID=27848 RepID=A0A3P8GKM3_9TREM|nr:unnamed protein product [Echinostoma caproni]
MVRYLHTKADRHINAFHKSLLVMLRSRLFGQCVWQYSGLTSSRCLKLMKPNIEVPSLLDRTKYRLGVGDLRYPARQLKAAGENMFAICAEYPVFEEFVDKLSLPDTFQSWFSLTALHIWMCLIRLRREGVEGQLIKRTLVNVSAKFYNINFTMNAFQMQFFGSMFAYDEGLLSHSDALLATALWRNLFMSCDTTSAVELELALEYLRKNLAHLDSLSSTTILRFGTPTFLPLVGKELNAHFANDRLRYCLSWPEFVN